MKTEICITCKREMVEVYDDMWFMNGQRISGGLVNTVHGKVACSEQCKSQHVYESLGERDQEALCDMARVAYQWFDKTEGGSLAWKLKHPAVSILVSGAVFTAVNTEVTELLKELAGQAFIDGDEDGPKWFQEAVGIGRKPLEIVKP